MFGEDAIRAGDLDAHLRLLLDALYPHWEVIREATRLPEVRADFFCFWASNESDGPTIQPETLVRMGELNASFALDIYYRGE